MSFISLDNISFSYSDIESGQPYKNAVDGVSLNIEKGEFVALLGHNGCGKSTVAKHLNAMLLPDKGKVYVDGDDTSDENKTYDIREKVGLVLQNPDNQLVASVVEEDVAFGPENLGIPPKEIRQRVDDALKAVDMYDYREHAPFKLSGGQKRRVAIAGVIVTKPEILVLDEPAAGLDPLGKREIMQLLHKIHKEWCKTVIIVSHDMDEISENCSRAAVFSGGRVIASAPPSELFLSPDRLTALGLDVPFTAKVTEFLAGRGIKILSDFTCRDFVEKVSEYAGIAGGEAHA